ncbi:MAG TPA: enoyl-CoA hydratase/isomerase family protein [Burkholderiales bacterium]|jgi:enoyl-CoA hydratase/carnithine racemase|nr:enoyl-CoA hydratase/isomerase family protein [Burkholderiales bacterium]
MAESVSPVLFEERAAANGARIGFARLNAERTLNALSLDMIDLLGPQFDRWAADEGVAMVVLEASGEKAFSAGADLHRMHRTMLEHHAGPRHGDIRGNEYAAAFFGREYRLDYRIHTFPKPVLCWGHGIVMGGGVGLMSGASHRVVTPDSKVAMPEITIGLFPDVGGSWLLGRMPGRSGLFLGLTGARIQAADALFTGMADCCIPQVEKPGIMEALLAQPWTRARDVNDRLLTRLLLSRARKDLAPGPVRQHLDAINGLCESGELHATVAAIAGLRTGDAWLDRAGATLAAGSPSTAGLTFELLRRARHLSLADVFRMEFVAALRCAQRPDLAEGIRALLIDKDQKPGWQPPTLAEVTPEWLAGYFESPWGAADHPLADLGR